MRSEETCLECISDDDDVAVIFTRDDGTKYYVIGNVEDIAVCKSIVDKNKIDGVTYLNDLDTVYNL